MYRILNYSADVGLNITPDLVIVCNSCLVFVTTFSAGQISVKVVCLLNTIVIYCAMCWFDFEDDWVVFFHDCAIVLGGGVSIAGGVVFLQFSYGRI